jgi:osmotically-inducible protein OsmY
MTRSFISLPAIAALALIPSLASASNLSAARTTPTETHFAAAAVAAAQATDDAAITEKIKASIAADPDVKGTSVDVSTAAGVVTLKGMVSSPVLRVKIYNITKATDGVTKIVNKITLPKK